MATNASGTLGAIIEKQHAACDLMATASPVPRSFGFGASSTQVPPHGQFSHTVPQRRSGPASSTATSACVQWSQVSKWDLQPTPMTQYLLLDVYYKG